MTEAPRVFVDDGNFMENGGGNKMEFEDFRQPLSGKEELGMSPEEEDCLDALMLDTGQDVNISETEQQYVPMHDGFRMEPDYMSGESSDEENDLCIQDQNVEDIKARNPTRLPFNSLRTAGIQLRMLSRFVKQTSKTPIHFFSFFLSFDLVASICFSTNMYAESQINQGLCKCYATGLGGRWVKVTTMEMYKFIGILMYMTVVELPTLGQYWTSDALFSNDIVKNAMNQTRFMAILAFLQISPEYDIKNDDKASRVAPIIKHMKTVSQSLYQPYRELVIADRMFRCKTQLPNKLTTENKQRFGCKLWSVVCSVTGFTYDMLVYLGQDNNTTLSKNSKGLPYAIAMELLKDLKLQGYQVYLGEFFTSKILTKDLFCKAVYVTGVLRNDSLAMPRNLRDWKEWEEAAIFGDFRWERNKDNYVVVQWKNRKTLSYLSTLHKGSDMVSESQAPKVAVDYQQGIQGVSKSVKHMNNYPFLVGGEQLHWWKCVFMHCIDIMVMNSYVIYKEYVDRFPTEFNNPSGELDFRESLIRSLLVTKPSVKIFEPCDLCLPEFINKRDCINCSSQAKMEGKSIPGIRTIVMCSHCEVALCLCKERNCFAQWHSEQGKSVREWVRIYGKTKIPGGITVSKN